MADAFALGSDAAAVTFRQYLCYGQAEAEAELFLVSPGSPCEVAKDVGNESELIPVRCLPIYILAWDLRK